MGTVSAKFGRISKPGKRFTAPRRLMSGNRKAVAQHNRRVGEVLYAFNIAQASFFVIFWQIMGEDFPLVSKLWDLQPGDTAQRKVLDVFVRQRVKRKSIQNALVWSLSAMDELGELRNDAVHADMLWYYDQLIPGLATKRSRRERLLKEPFELKWRKLRGDLAAVANYVNALHSDLMMDEPWPSTKRPKLQLVRSTSARRQNQRRQAKKAARARQRTPSPG